jgi:repressor LexA
MNVSVTSVTDKKMEMNLMRSKCSELKRNIYDFVNAWRRDNGRSPSLKNIADEMGVSRTTVYRYLLEMNDENWGLTYTGDSIETREFNSENTYLSTAKVVGSIPCGEATPEEEYVEDYITLPASLFGKGEFYILCAREDSMVDVEINEGDLVVIRKQQNAEIGDIVVALDDENCNTLKRFSGFDDKGNAILEYMNQEVYPDKIIIVKELVVQGVAKHVIKKL